MAKKTVLVPVLHLYQLCAYPEERVTSISGGVHIKPLLPVPVPVQVILLCTCPKERVTSMSEGVHSTRTKHEISFLYYKQLMYV